MKRITFLLFLVLVLSSSSTNANEFVAYRSLEDLDDMCSMVCPDAPPPCWANCPPCGRPKDGHLYINIWDQPWKIEIFRGDDYMCWGAYSDIYFHFVAYPSYNRNGVRTSPVGGNDDVMHEKIGLNYYLSSPFRNKSMLIEYGAERDTNCPKDLQNSRFHRAIGNCYDGANVISQGWGDNVVLPVSFWEHSTRGVTPNWRNSIKMTPPAFSIVKQKHYAFMELNSHYDNVGRPLRVEIPSHYHGANKYIESFNPYINEPWDGSNKIIEVDSGW